jgi:hypothetical protein
MWFLLMNVLDMALTYIVLNSQRREDGWIITGDEGNQVARYFLDRWGFKGLFGFKLASAALVCGIAYVIAFKNVATSRRLLAFGTIVLASVVIYSLLLARFLIHGPGPGPGLFG